MVTVHVPWSSKTNTTLIWNEITANIINHFGLPGGRYTTELSSDHMNFIFENDQDGLMCKILISDYV